MVKLMINKGSLVKLSDKESLSSAYSEGKYVDYVEYKVIEVEVFDFGETHYILHTLDEANLYLLEKVFNDESYFIFCTIPDFFFVGDNYGGSRQEYLDKGCQFLFKEPKDVNNYEICNLELTDFIPGNSDEGKEVEYVHIEKSLHGLVSDNMVELKHFRCNDIVNTEMVIIEIENLINKCTGHDSYIRVFNGYVLNEGEITVDE